MAIHGCVGLTANYIEKVHNTNDFQYQAFSSLDKHDNHISTTVKVKETSSWSTWCGLANWQQAHVVIEIIILLTRLTRRLHSSKLYLSKSLTTPFIKILHRQTVALYGS